MHEFNWIDYGIIGILSISVIFGIVRGFFREAMSLVTWLAAIVVGFCYKEHVAAWFENSISLEWVRLIIAFILLVLLTLIVGGIISFLLSKLIHSKFKFNIVDRIVGMVCGLMVGFIKGIVIVSTLILLVNLMDTKPGPIWRQSYLVPKFEPVAHWIQQILPDSMLQIFETPQDTELYDKKAPIISHKKEVK